MPGVSAASPNWCRTSKTAASPREPSPEAAPKAAELQSCVDPSYTASVPGRPGSDPACPRRCRRTD